MKKRIERNKEKIPSAKTFATFYLNFWPKNAHNSAVQRFPRDVNVGIHSVLCGEAFNTKKTAKKGLIKNFSAKTFCIGEKFRWQKRQLLKDVWTSNHSKQKFILLKFMVNYFFSHFYQVCISKRFFHSRSGHFTFGSDCTVAKSGKKLRKKART